ncbi:MULTISPECIES: hypothetical protein [unclassified Bradyrhizobium]|uniref:hypothetical protein n=1 Tax=unclassified Bradyrhizobium TaxID=2631580 RepID=UPI001CD250DB|nr:MULTISPECIES: hypothetical protein [unclassified Bradyrhizobium]MCA1429364.1 hypothetical protein [Bradyrhizobium sp. NBAIM16]MCA1508366.1 hypothetical protein [Bradyrhizobium sp. NBAIM02]MCA1512690.1 hypothetical protein [Bradyrhizobium sp. NBAIM01]
MHPAPALKVYIPDPTNAECEDSSARFRDTLVAEFQLPFEETDIGTGASEQAFWTVLTDAWPVVAAIAVLFSGKKIEENIEAWQKLFKRLGPFIDRGAIFDREGAAILAMDGLRLALGRLPDTVRLVGYHTDSLLNWVNDSPEVWQADRSPVSTIDPPLDQVQGATIHILQIEADGRMFKVVVQGSRVFTMEL